MAGYPLSMRCLFLLLSSGLLLSAAPGQVLVTGIVRDARSGTPIAFANLLVEGERLGASSDMDGRIILMVPAFPAVVRVSCVGYAPTRSVREGPGPFEVALTPSMEQLSSVDISPEANPAHRIIEMATTKRHMNDGVGHHAHRYRAYSKTIFTLAVDSALLNDTTRIAALPEQDRDAVRFAGRQHILLMESASRCTSDPPRRRTEEVLALRVSGLEDPSLLALAASSRSWSIYDAEIVLNERRFPGPLAPGSTKRYFFLIEDTLYVEADTVFVLRFRPRTGQRFDGLQGQLAIHSASYAVQHVVAEPVEQRASLGMRMRQLHQRSGDTWFPVQVENTLYLDLLQMESYKLMGLARTDLSEIETDVVLTPRELRGADLVADHMETRASQTYWDSLRSAPLDAKDRSTYRTIDSLGQAEGLDRTVKVLDALARGAIPYGPFEFPLDRIVGYNGYEGFRLGLGIRTNERFSRWFQVGGYGAYGTMDKATKYGGELTVRPWSSRDMELRMYYTNDVVETGGWVFPSSRSFLSEESYRLLYVTRMDAVERYAAEAGIRIFRDLKFWLGTERALRVDRTGYSYAEVPAEGVVLHRSSYLTGAVIFGLRYSFGERGARLRGRYVVTDPGGPVVQLTAWRALNGLWEGEWDSWRLVAQAEHTFRHGMKALTLRVVGAMADPQAPAPFLFNLRGTYEQDLSVATPFAFETMRPNEFVADHSIMAHVRFGLGPVLWRSKYSRPALMLIGNAAMGDMDHPERHVGWDITTPKLGFYEAGAQLNNLLRSGIAGLGLLVAYRLGPYSFGAFEDDVAAKVSLSLSL